MAREELAALQPIVERDQLAERTYEAIRGAVLEERILAGTSLSVPELARRLGVSRSPVREAVQRLIHDGLATQQRYRGATVKQADPDDIMDLFVVREPLEGLAASLATRVAGLDDVRRLRAMMAEHEGLVRGHQALSLHTALDVRFHREIRVVAGNRHLSDMLELVATQSHSVLGTLWEAPNATSLALDEHEKIVDCIEAGDQSRADAAAREHIARLRVRLRRVFLEVPETAPSDVQMQPMSS